jgi:hypothetical protein
MRCAPKERRSWHERTAYILIQTEVGKAADVATQVRVPGVAEADDVTGPYDVIARRSRPDRRTSVASW